MTRKITRSMGAALVAATLTLTMGCSSESSPDPVADPPATVAEKPAAKEKTDADKELPKDTTVDAFVVAIEAAFSSKNAAARWEGDAMHVKMDGDVEEMVVPAFQECMVLDQVLDNGRESVIEFPGGTFKCAEVLKDV